MNDNIIGRFAISKAGRDKGCVYLVVAQEGAYLYLSDGKYHPLDKPKKKNRKHIQVMDQTVGEPFWGRLNNNERVFDHEVKYAIKTIAGKEEGYVKE